MTQAETTSLRKHTSHPILIGVVGLFVFAACLPVVLMMLGLWKNPLRTLILYLYIPQVGVIALAMVTIAGIAFAIKRHKFDEWGTYKPLVLLAVYCSVVMIASRLLVGSAIHTKIDNPENRMWSEAMVSRALGEYPTGVTCVLSDEVVVLVREWSFVTPDGHMPVLTWSKSSLPSSKLLGQPISCTSLRRNWYICYLSKPYQLAVDKNACD